MEMSEVEAVAPQLDLAGDAGIQRLPLSSSVEDSPLGEAEFPLTIFSMWCVYHMAWYWFFRFAFRRFQQFKKKLQDLNIPYDSEVEWYCRMVSTEHAIGALILALLWNLNVLPKSVLLTHTAGYFVYDIFVVLTHWKDFKEDFCTLIHHGVGTIGSWAALFCPVPDWLISYYLLTEVSTVFVNLRWNFYLFQMKDRAVYLVVGLLMAFSFFLVRTLPLPYVLVRGCILVWWDTNKDYSIPMKIVQTVLVGVLCGLNSFWSVKIVQGLTKHLFAKKKDLLVRQP
jgi:hypothetical protein